MYAFKVEGLAVAHLELCFATLLMPRHCNIDGGTMLYNMYVQIMMVST
jgi:hypothetical protein